MREGVLMEDCVFTIDGNMWCCTFVEFTNLQEHPAGFGETQEEAFLDLMEESND